MSTTTTPAVRRRRKVKTDHHPLEALIPEAWMGEEYVSRKVHGVVDAKLLAKAAEYMDNVIISGPTGSAKTSLVMAFGAGFQGTTKRARNAETGEMETVNVLDGKRRPVVYIPCNGGITPDVLYGRQVAKSDRTFTFSVGDFVKGIIYGAIIYADEVNFLLPNIASALHGLLDKRRTVVVHDAAGSGVCNKCAHVNGSEAYEKDAGPGKPLFTCESCGVDNFTDTVFTAHEETMVIAAYNPNYRGTKKLNEAFLNRFAIKIPFPYDQGVEKQLLYSERLIEVANQLRASYNDGEISTPVSTNMLIEFERFALDPDLGYGFAVENFLSAFDDSDRQSVSNVFVNNTAAIQSELLDDVADTDVSDDDLDAADNLL